MYQYIIFIPNISIFFIYRVEIMFNGLFGSILLLTMWFLFPKLIINLNIHMEMCWSIKWVKQFTVGRMIIVLVSVAINTLPVYEFRLIICNRGNSYSSNFIRLKICIEQWSINILHGIHNFMLLWFISVLEKSLS